MKGLKKFAFRAPFLRNFLKCVLHQNEGVNKEKGGRHGFFSREPNRRKRQSESPAWWCREGGWASSLEVRGGQSLQQDDRQEESGAGGYDYKRRASTQGGRKLTGQSSPIGHPSDQLPDRLTFSSLRHPPTSRATSWILSSLRPAPPPETSCWDCLSWHLHTFTATEPALPPDQELLLLNPPRPPALSPSFEGNHLPPLPLRTGAPLTMVKDTMSSSWLRVVSN